MKVFVDRFDNKSYTLSIKELEEYVTDIAVIYDYQNDNPYISITGKHTLSEIKEIIYTIEEQQKDIDVFGIMISKLNSEKKD